MTEGIKLGEVRKAQKCSFVNFRLEEELKLKLTIAAHIDGKCVGELMRDLIIEYLAQRKLEETDIEEALAKKQKRIEQLRAKLELLTGEEE